MTANTAVSVGTKFNFAVALGNVASPLPSLKSGDFELVMSVKDSSNVVLAQKSLDGNSNNDDIAFEYTLDTAALPSGSLEFSFTVGSHTAASVSYSFTIDMVLLDLDLASKEVQLGERLELSFKPASFSQDVDATPYSNSDATGKPALRRFFVDVVPVLGGAPAKSVAGTPEATDAGVQTYTFSLPTEESLELVGEYALQFRYVTSEGESVTLKNFVSGAVSTEPITFSVKVALQATDVENISFPADKTVSYGNTLHLTFKLKDTVSGVSVAPVGDATVYLALRHSDKKGGLYTSSEVPATYTDGTYDIQFVVNPNAQKGPGTFQLLARGLGGEYVPVSTSSQKQWSVDVEVGGDIDVQEEVSTGSFADVRVSQDSSVLYSYFTIPFTLGSDGENLAGAELYAVVKNGKGLTGQEGPVFETTDEEGEVDGYQVSFVAPIEQTPSGHYTVDFYLESDRKRGLDQAEPFFSVQFDFKVTSPSDISFLLLFLISLPLFFSVFAIPPSSCPSHQLMMWRVTHSLHFRFDAIPILS